MAKKKKAEKVDIIDAEIIEEISEPNLDFDDKKKSRKQPRGTRKKDFPAFTHTTREKLLQVLSLGTPHTIASKLAGIHPQTLETWLDRGEDAQTRLDDGETLLPVEKDFADFYVRCNQVTANAVTSLLASLMKEAQENPNIALKLLEKLAPDDFGARQQIEMKGRLDHAHAHIHGKIEDGSIVAKELKTKDLRWLKEEYAKKKAKQLEAGEITDAEEEE